MSPAEVLTVARRAGVAVGVDGDDLVLKARRQPDDRLLALLRRHKPEIVRLLRGTDNWTEEDWRALFDERAGIIEFDGRLPRMEAEARARDEVALMRRDEATSTTSTSNASSVASVAMKPSLRADHG
jgi:hypothetical protein